MTKYFCAAAIAALSLTTTASATTISLGFEGLPHGPIDATLMEDGFTLEFEDMFIDAVSGPDGTDGPTEAERLALSDGTLTITRPGSDFTFGSIDWQAEVGTASVSIAGYLDTVLVGTDTFESSSSAYATFSAVSLFDLTLDTLVISADRTTGVLGAFDAVVLSDARTTAPVPLPATGLLLLSGFGGLAYARRRRKS